MRSRHRAGYSGRWQRRESNLSYVEAPSPPFGPLIKEVRVANLAGDSAQYQKTAVIGDCHLLATFNWVDRKLEGPTILVPGKPPRWTPPMSPPRLKEDLGEYFRDKNAARFPDHPLEPAVVAMLDADPDIGAKLDIVGCASTLGNLLRFARGGDKPFRILVQMINGVAFFTRRENSPRELIHGVRGYGHTFPEAYTTWDAEVKGSLSHQRVIRYLFGGLRIAIRFEGDGYLTGAVATSDLEQATSIDDLTSIFGAGSITTQVMPGTAISVERAGEVIAQDSVFDLKTRSAWKKIQNIMIEELPRLWIDQIPNFIVAYHTSGIFREIEVKDVREDVKEWEKAENATLSKLAALLHLIIAEVGIVDGLRMELFHNGSGTLQLCEQLPEVSSALSSQVVAQWAQNAKDADLEVKWADNDDYTACTAKCGYCGQCC